MIVSIRMGHAAAGTGNPVGSGPGGTLEREAQYSGIACHCQVEGATVAAWWFTRWVATVIMADDEDTGRRAEG